MVAWQEEQRAAKSGGTTLLCRRRGSGSLHFDRVIILSELLFSVSWGSDARVGPLLDECWAGCATVTGQQRVLVVVKVERRGEEVSRFTPHWLLTSARERQRSRHVGVQCQADVSGDRVKQPLIEAEAGDP